MDKRWNLDDLYTSFESEAFNSDLEKCFKEIENISEWVENNLKNSENAIEKLENYINMLNAFYMQYTRLMSFAELTQSTEAKNEKAAQTVEKLENKITRLTEPQVRFMQWLSSLENLQDIIGKSELLKEHSFYLMEVYRSSKYMLSEKEEVLIARMKNTGSNAWSRLQELLTSTILVDINVDGEDKSLPLQVVRNMAYEKDESKRRTAYEAELKAYGQFEDSSAACLNGIKGEVLTLTEMRGYKSPLEKTLMDSRMDQETLDAMLTAIKEALPSFHKYFRKKAELLGYTNGLPFFNLFAPMGESEMEFTYEQAKEFIIKNFKSFSDKLSDYAQKVFDNRWIDAEPREGKRGGAFCSNLHSIGQSRVLTNFSNSFSDVVTLAHELGHAYHGECLKDEYYLNSDYPMPIAETASIFCETIIKNAALKTANQEETFTILEGSISDSSQVIIDIYSRFLFESEVFERRKESSLSVNELKQIMIDSQKKAYGYGLDPEYLHPYMWACKPHYYYADYNFYNFPYAFGLLFALGLYAEYLKRGKSFIDEYDKLLAVTGKMSIPDIAAIMGIDVRSTEYWRNSLRIVEEDIEKFIRMYR